MIYQAEDQSYWEYVCHVPDAASAVGQVVLRGSDGKTKLVPAADVGEAGKPFILVVGEPPEPPEPLEPVGDALKELLANCRHVGGLRFIALPLFVTGMAALAREYLTPPLPPLARPFDDGLLLAQAGLGLSLILLAFETVLSFNLISWWRAFEERAKGTPWMVLTTHRNPWLLWLTRLALFAPYPLAAAYWSQKIPGSVAMGLGWSALLFAAPSVAVWAWATRHRKIT